MGHGLCKSLGSSWGRCSLNTRRLGVVGVLLFGLSWFLVFVSQGSELKCFTCDMYTYLLHKANFFRLANAAYLCIRHICIVVGRDAIGICCS